MEQALLTRYIDNISMLRIYTAVTTQVTREITTVHETTPNATMPLGRTITAAALLSATLKPESSQSISVKFHGEGPLKEISVQASAAGDLRGYTGNPGIDYTEELDRIDFSKAMGAGMLTITRDLDMKKPYTGIVPMMYGDVAMDITHYLVESDQVPSALILAQELDDEGTIVISGGILIQSFPDTSQEVLNSLQDMLEGAEDLGRWLAHGKTIEEFLQVELDLSPTFLSSTSLRHSCSCSREYLLGMLESIEADELSAMAHEDNGAEITCTFCKEQYSFTKDDIMEVLRKKEYPV
jgi:molecular chaperone Hsp33